MSGPVSFAYTLVRHVHLAVHSPAVPRDDEWQAYLTDIERRLGTIEALLAFAPGGNLSAAQRKQSTQFWHRQSKKVPIAIITPDIMVVRLVGALRWFMPSQIKVFLPRNLEAALDYLQINSEHRPAVLRSARELARQQGLPDPTAVSSCAR